jgi:hypothetical protein
MGCKKTSSNLESIRRTTIEQSQIWDSLWRDFFFTDGVCGDCSRNLKQFDNIKNEINGMGSLAKKQTSFELY